MKTWVLPASALLHAAALAALLPWPAGGGTAEAPPIEVELVQQSASTKGGAPAQAAHAASAPSPAANPAPPDPAPAPVPASSPSAATPSEPPSPPAAVNLGDADETRDGMDVTGRNIVPPAPDSAYRNQPPAYPAEAARAGAEGTVSLLIHVSAEGLPREVVVAGSSGTSSLDRAARNAVRRWRFIPARRNGAPVPFDYPLDIRFVLGDRP